MEKESALLKIHESDIGELKIPINLEKELVIIINSDDKGISE